jgi:hypothetical protein
VLANDVWEMQFVFLRSNRRSENIKRCVVRIFHQTRLSSVGRYQGFSIVLHMLLSFSV